METLYAYLAGAIDADGFISIGRKVGSRKRADGSLPIYYIVKIGLSETSAIIPNLLHEAFPSWRGEYTPKNPTHKKWFIWQATNEKSRQPLVNLLPYLRLKKKQAEIALRFIELLKQQNRGRFMAIQITREQAAEREMLYRELTHLNAPRNRRVHFAGTPSPVAP